MAALSAREMLSLSVVCILLFKISNTRAQNGHDEHDHHKQESGTYEVDGVEGLDTFEAILHFVDLHSESHDAEPVERNLTDHDVEVLVDTWWERFDCYIAETEEHEHEHHNESKHSICKQCLNETILFTILEADQEVGISEEVFPQLSTILLYYTLNLTYACEQNSPTYHKIIENLVGASNDSWHEEDLDEILHSLSGSYTPTTESKCFTAHDVELESDHENSTSTHHAREKNSTSTHHAEENIELQASRIVTNLILGKCIGEPTAIDEHAFLQEVFEHYGNADGIITEEGFEKLLADLGIAQEHNDEEHDDHAHEDKHDHGNEHLHRRKRREESGAHDHEDERGHDESLTVEQCFSGEELLDIYGVDHEAGINKGTFHELCPALIQQITSGACQEEEHQHDDHGEKAASSDLTMGEVWGYGFIAVLLISLLAFGGIAVLPCLNSKLYENAIQMLMALAVATLSGDAILHLIPQAVGLHSHEPTTNGHNYDHAHEEEDHGPLSEELQYVWKCLVAYLAIYMFFLFESMVEMYGGAHTHDHMEHNSLRMKELHGETNLAHQPDSTSTQELAKPDMRDEVVTRGGHSHGTGCFGKGALPVMVILGDTLHNFGDGLAIGAAFSTGAASGVSTSIAVLCHELPHELGNFAVLINSGLSIKMALFLNFASALSAFLGLIVGILVSVHTSAREWIFAAAAGMFLYVALVDMMPELIHHQGSKGQSRTLLFVLQQNIGFLIGALIILIIALYEDAIINGL